MWDDMEQAHELTVCPEEVIEELEKREAVPALGGLDLQSGIHVNGIEGQEVFCMLNHEVCPPGKRLQTQQEGEQKGEQGVLFGERDETKERRHTGFLKGNVPGFFSYESV